MKVPAAAGQYQAVRGGGQATAEQLREGGCCQASQGEQQGGSRRWGIALYSGTPGGHVFIQIKFVF